MADALYRFADDLYHPTEWASSPWSRESQHGGPVNALLARATLHAAEQTELQPARLCIDLLGPVPLSPLRLEWSVASRSRRTALVDARLCDGDRPVARGHALLLAVSEPGSRPRSWVEPEAGLPDPDRLESTPLMHRSYRESSLPGFHFSLDVRMVPLQAAAWLTTPLDLVEGQPIASFERAAALADLTAGLSARTQLRQRLVDVNAPREMYINTDTTLQLERMPEGAWLGIEKSLLSDRDGIGHATVFLHDASGRFGVAQQSLLARS